MKISTILAPACLALLLAGCSSVQTSAEGARDFPMGIEPGETVAVVLRSYVGPKDNDLRSDEAKKSLENCVGRAMSSADRRLVLADANHPQLRYRVDVDASVTRSPSRASGSGIIATWIESINYSGVVYDIKRQSTVGRLSASAHGEQGAGIVLAIIIPIPVVIDARTESSVCREFGRQLAELLVDSSPVSRPDPVRPPGAGNDFVNCVVNGKREWAVQSRCD